MNRKLIEIYWKVILFFITFLMVPASVPKNASEWGPVVVAVTDVIEISSKLNSACAVIGETPLILRPTAQKL